MKTRKIIVKLFLLLFFTAQFAGLSLLFPKELGSANLTSVSNTLSNNRLSFRGQVSGNHSAGTAVITLQTTPGSMDTVNTSTGSAALMGNESVQVGTNNDARTLRTIESDSRIVLSSGITNAVLNAAPVFATSSAIHTVRFTPVSTIADGAFRVLIPASSLNANDGIPDRNGFDFSAAAPTVSCTGPANMTFGTNHGTATASAIQVPTGTWYHSFECRYSGTGATLAAVTMIIGTPAANKLINPSPSAATGRTPGPGGAETYTFRVRQTHGIAQTYSVVDETIGTIGVVEAVRVTATVAPTLTFTITGLSADTGSPYCNVARNENSPDSTVSLVPFGTISTTAFTDAAQLLSISTNAAGGYSVTASQSAKLTAWTLSGTPTIPDTTCQATPCTVTTPRTWTSAAFKGLGYALHDLTGDAVPAGIEFTDGWRPFGITAQQIMTDTTTVDIDQAYVCYRVVVSGTQAAGDYENYIIYIATATF